MTIRLMLPSTVTQCLVYLPNGSIAVYSSPEHQVLIGITTRESEAVKLLEAFEKQAARRHLVARLLADRAGVVKTD